MLPIQKGQELKLLFIGDMAFLTKEVILNFTQVKLSDQPVRFKSEAYWTVRVISYIETEKRLHVEVLKYYVGRADFSYEQLQLEDVLSEVGIVTFEDIDPSGLHLTLNGTSPLAYKSPNRQPLYRPKTTVSIPPVERAPVVKQYEEPFSIAIKDLTFHNGYVSFEKKLPGFKKPVAFQISNAYMFEQYDAIKNYFAVVLKTKKVEVVPRITLMDGDITSVHAVSAEIDRIDPTFIEEVKFELLRSNRRKDLSEDQLLFGVDKYIQELTDDANGSLIFNDDNDFMQVILERSGTKHYHHLRFLSSKQQVDLQKLCVIHRPFSFVFFFAGAQYFHIVWETLDTTEATYIWSITKDDNAASEFVKNTHAIIHRILRDGKSDYISEKEENFTRVFHDYTSLEMGFIIWKQEIEMVIYR